MTPAGPPSPPADLREAGLVESFRETAIAAGALSAGAFLEEALRHLGSLSGAEGCSILLVEDGRLHHGAAKGLPAAYLAAVDGLVITATAGTCGAAAATGRPHLSPDLREDPNWTPDLLGAAEAAGLRSCWSIPVTTPDGRVLATFATYGASPGAPGEAELRAVQEYAPIVALGLESIRRQAELALSYESIVLALTSALDSRDEYTASHSAQTAALAARVGVRLGLDAFALEVLARTAVLHDVGKLGIPTQILGKPGPLTGAEWEIMRTHPVIGERILRRVPFLEDIARAVRHEHERWDGTGYPDALAGEHIPLHSRIVLVCDSYHAMTSDRPYRAGIGSAAARAELAANAGSQFDPEVVAALLDELGSPGPQPQLAGHLVRAQARGHALGALADQLGAADVFVLRREVGDRWTHLDGLGRGSGWAGNIELRAAREPALRQALFSGEPVRLAGEAPVRVAGPYFARSAALVPVDADVVVIFGAPTAALATADPVRLRTMAERAARVVVAVPSARLMEDELEVLGAIRAVTTVSGEALDATLAGVARCAADALSCEFAAVATRPTPGAEPAVGWACPGWTPASDAVVRVAMERLLALRPELPLLVQDTAGPDPPLELEGLGAPDGITSLKAVGVGADAVLLLAHASTAPRGFTMLCRRVAGAMADAADAVVRRAVAQERLTAENQALARRVATDALTGVASRDWWEVRLAGLAGDEEVPWSIVAVDLDDLKRVNDTRGHRVGDDLLRACADVLQGCCRPGDRVARIGGDEFAVLLPDAGPEEATAFCDRLGDAVQAYNRRTPELPVSLSYGCASAAAGTGLHAALLLADERMYADKRARHAPQGP